MMKFIALAVSFLCVFPQRLNTEKIKQCKALILKVELRFFIRFPSSRGTTIMDIAVTGDNTTKEKRRDMLYV